MVDWKICRLPWVHGQVKMKLLLAHNPVVCGVRALILS